MRDHANESGTGQDIARRAIERYGILLAQAAEAPVGTVEIDLFLIRGTGADSQRTENHGNDPEIHLSAKSQRLVRALD